MGQAPQYGTADPAQSRHDFIVAYGGGGLIVAFFPFIFLVLWWMGSL